MSTDQFSDPVSPSSMTADELLPLIYDELRSLAARKLRGEKMPQTLQPTALVHEVYLRLVSSYPDHNWRNSREFFLASAEVMRRILVDIARRKKAERHGGEFSRIDFPPELASTLGKVPDIIAFDEILSQLESHDSLHADYVKARFYVGFTHAETAAALNLTTRQADNVWAVSRAWLIRKLEKE